MPLISLIAAMNRRRAIGLGNALLWNLPRDMRHFRQTTVGKPVVMGRSTFESIGRPLPKRTNVVLSRRGFEAPGCVVVASIDEAIGAAGDAEEIMVIGGAQIYAQFLPRAHRVYLTHVDNDAEGDAFFPPLDPTQWHPRHEVLHEPDGDNAFACRFVTYERI